MRKVFTAAAFALFGLMVSRADAMPFPALNDGLSGVTPVAFGCGPGWNSWTLRRVPSDGRLWLCRAACLWLRLPPICPCLRLARLRLSSIRARLRLSSLLSLLAARARSVARGYPKVFSRRRCRTPCAGQRHERRNVEGAQCLDWPPAPCFRTNEKGGLGGGRPGQR